MKKFAQAALVGALALVMTACNSVQRDVGAFVGHERSQREAAIERAAQEKYGFMQPVRAAWNTHEDTIAKAEGRKPWRLGEYWSIDSSGEIFTALNGRDTSDVFSEWKRLAAQRPATGTFERDGWNTAMEVNHGRYVMIPGQIDRVIKFIESNPVALDTSTTAEQRAQAIAELQRVKGLVENKAAIAANYNDDAHGVVADLNPLDTTMAAATPVQPKGEQGAPTLTKRDLNKGMQVGGALANGNVANAAMQAAK